MVVGRNMYISDGDVKQKVQQDFEHGPGKKVVAVAVRGSGVQGSHQRLQVWSDWMKLEMTGCDRPADQ